MAHKFQKRCSTIGPSPGFSTILPCFFNFLLGGQGIARLPQLSRRKTCGTWRFARKTWVAMTKPCPCCSKHWRNFSCTNRTIQTLGAQALHDDLQAMYKGGELGGIDRKTNVMLPGVHVFMSFHMCSCDLRTVYDCLCLILLWVSHDLNPQGPTGVTWVCPTCRGAVPGGTPKRQSPWGRW